MDYTEKYFVQAMKDKRWVDLSESCAEGEAVTELDYQYDTALREGRPTSLRVIRRSEVTIHARSRA